MQEAYKWLGRKIGGKEGEKIANGVFNAVDLGLGVASAGGAVKLASKVEKIVTDLKPGLIKGVFKATSSKASSIVRTVKTEFGQLAKHYNKQSGTMLSSNIAGEGQKIYDTVKGYLKEKTAKTGAGAGEAVSKGETVTKVSGKLTETKQSVIDKLDKYLLNPDHQVGKDKAIWFQKALGFTKNNMMDLAKQIKFDPTKAVETATTQYGTKFNQVISITGANGKVIDVNFAWIKNNDGVVRLVTAIPTKK